MSLKSRFQADRETLARLDRKGKVQFIWDYYKLPIVALGVCLALLVSVVSINLSRWDTVMYAVFVNTDQTGVEPDAALLDAVLEEAGVDMRKKHIDVTATLTLGQKAA